MGYRSDVGYILAFPTKKARDAFVAVHRFKSNEVVQELDKLEETGAQILAFTASCVKWYEDYDDVKIHEEFMRTCVDHFDGAYRFARTGEESGDVEEISEGDEDLYELCDVYVHSTVVINTEPVDSY